MPLQIPVQPDGDRKVVVTLGENTLQFRTYFNSLINYYKLDLLTELGEPIVLGITLKSTFNLLVRPELQKTIGSLRMTQDATPFGSLGQTAQLLWFASDDGFSDDDLIGDVTTLPVTYDFEELFPRRNNPLT